MDRRTLVLSGLAALGGCASTGAGSGPPAPYSGGPPRLAPTYDSQEIVNAVSDFMGVTAEAAGAAVERVFKDNGNPTGYIAGEELSAAITGGLRYGHGFLYMKDKPNMTVYWQGPSVGFDWGGDGARTMTLVYNLPSTNAIYQRFAGIDGSAYIIGGFGMTALTANNIVLVPIRSGIGLRLGANIGYLKYTPQPTWNPF